MRQEVRRILGWWDPLYVAADTDPEEEYKFYVPKITSMVRAGQSRQAILAELNRIESEEMGLRGHCERNEEAARRLADLAD